MKKEGEKAHFQRIITAFGKMSLKKKSRRSKKSGFRGVEPGQSSWGGGGELGRSQWLLVGALHWGTEKK